MKKKLQVSYPWQQLKRGEGFFVPCLDPEAVKLNGLRDALRYRLFYAKAETVIKEGKLGVWFHL
jgi:hypothetical protein